MGCCRFVTVHLLSLTLSFGNMIAFFVNIFHFGTFWTISYQTKILKLISIGFYHIAVIDMNNRLLRNTLANERKIRFQSSRWNTLIELSGKTFNRIDFFVFSWSWSTMSVRFWFDTLILLQKLRGFLIFGAFFESCL